MKLLLPLFLLLVGVAGGVGAGLAMRPDPTSQDADMAAHTGAADADHSNAADTVSSDDHADAGHGADDHYENDHGAGAGSEYIKLNNQFVVPIVARDSIEAVIVMSLSLEVPAGQSEAVYLHEPKLRDAFLQVMFDHANMGGFTGIFTDTAKLDVLRLGLREVAATILSDGVESVLITDLVRQQM